METIEIELSSELMENCAKVAANLKIKCADLLSFLLEGRLNLISLRVD